MGLDISAYQIVGVVLEESDIRTVTAEQKRGCSHPVGTMDSFCPKCGKPAWIDTETERLTPLGERLGLDPGIADEYFCCIVDEIEHGELSAINTTPSGIYHYETEEEAFCVLGKVIWKADVIYHQPQRSAPALTVPCLTAIVANVKGWLEEIDEELAKRPIRLYASIHPSY